MSAGKSLKVQGFAALAVMTLTAATLWWSAHTHTNEHIHTLQAMTETSHAQAELQKHTLTVRSGVLRNYDPLNDAIIHLRRAQTEAAVLAPQVVGHSTELDSEFTALAALTDRKAGLIERYTTRVSQYRNSLTYLPIALDEWTQSVGGGATSPDHATAAQTLVRLALTYNGTPTQKYRTQLSDAIDAAERLPELSSTPAQRSWTLLFQHVRVVREMAEPLSEIVEQLLRPDVQQAVQSVHATYVDQYTSVQRTRSTIQRITYGLVVVSGLLFANLILRLRGLYSTLEQRIARRTEELAEVVAGSRNILDNVGEGLISVDLNGLPGSQASTALRMWLGEPAQAETIWQWIARFAPKQASWFELAWEDLQAGFMPHEVILAQLPNRIELDSRTIELRYSPILDGEGNLQRVLLIMRDVTRQEQAARQQAGDAERLAVLMHAMNDRAGLSECMEQTSALLDRMERSTHDSILSKRQLHTIKGNVGMFGMQRMAEACHQLETRLEKDKSSPTLEDISNLRQEWKHYEHEVEPFFRKDISTSREIAKLEHMAGLIEQRAPYAQLSATAATWKEEPMEVRLARLARQAEQMANRLERPVDVLIQPNGVRTPPGILDSLWLSVPHIIRNALDHGLEDPDVRVAQGKSAKGRLVLATRRENDAFVLSIRDDGAGIDWEAFRHKARALGLPHQSQSDLEAMLFKDGVSTRETVTESSGRGIGMAVTRQATERLGGTLSVNSEPNRGTVIECHIPDVFDTQSRLAG